MTVKSAWIALEPCAERLVVFAISTLWELWSSQMDPLQSDLKTIAAALKEKPDLLDEKMKAKLSDVRANLFLLEKDGSRGAHNVDFTAEILSVAAKDLRSIKSSMK